MAPHWTPEEDSLLEEIYPHNSKEAILERIDKPWSTIRRRAIRLNLHRDKHIIDEDRKRRRKRRSDSCTPEEENLLKEIYENNSKEYILSRFEPFNRSWQSISRFAKILGLKRNKEIVLDEMKSGSQKGADVIRWPEDEIETLKRVYESGNKSDIIASLPGRTWRAIREQAIRLKLRRDEDIIIEERNTALKKTMRSRYGVDYSTQLQSMKEKSRQTNMELRGVEYPTQSEKVREKIQGIVQKRYGVDNVFQSEDIKAKSKKTMIEKHGKSNPMQVDEIREKASSTCEEKYGVRNPFQMTDRVREGMFRKYGYAFPMQVGTLLQKANNTNIQRYGFTRPAQNPEIREKIRKAHLSNHVKVKKYLGMRKKGYFHSSKGEDQFLDYLREIDPYTVSHKLHPVLKHVIDYYMHEYDMWVQYDGSYWHGKTERPKEGPQSKNIEKIIERDRLQNEVIPNLLRFDEKEVNEAANRTDVLTFIKERLLNKLRDLDSKRYRICHQFKKKVEWFDYDIDTLSFDVSNIKASHFDLSREDYSQEIKSFIEKYEWLGSVGRYPSHCFTARYRSILAGVVLITDPIGRSYLLGPETPKYEALINRGATASWTPKNLGSRLIMFSCKWMSRNTDKRLFTAYADPRAGERGIIYQACGFDYLGNNFGASALYDHPYMGKKFTPLYLRQTHVFRKWCRENGIPLKKEWFKDNGTKNLEAIPENLKRAWYEWGRIILRESTKTEIERKGKYALLLGRDKRDRKNLSALKTYQSQPYPSNPQKTNFQPLTPQGKTRDRKSKTKIDFIIQNHGKMSRLELSHQLNESPRWVKRQISALNKKGLLTTKN